MMAILHKADSNSHGATIACSLFLLSLPEELVPKCLLQVGAIFESHPREKVNMHSMHIYHVVQTHRVSPFALFSNTWKAHKKKWLK